MKKILAFILLFALIFLYGCGNNVSTTEETKAPDTYDTEATTGSTATTSEPVKNKDDYSDIECKKISDYVNVNFSVGEDATALNMNIPKTWVLTKKSDSEYTIKCSGKNIGSVYLGIMTPENVETVYSDTQNKRNIIDSVYSIDKYENGDEVTFKRRISFTYTNEKNQKQSVTFNIDYAETDDTAFSRIRRIIQTTELKYLPEVGNIDLSEGNGKKSILVLGNSFVGTSRIGETLYDIFPRSYYIEAISRGYASVKTYIEDDYLMERIENGEFGILFMCGFYSVTDVEAFEKIKAACDVSDTILVIFPAHNESENRIKSVCSKYPDLHFVDWRGEIEKLIFSFVDYNDLCIQDSHKHSTPLAGYIGAHMIYRSIMGEFPSNAVSTAISQKYVEEKLGNYIKTGVISKNKDNPLYCFD